MRQLSLLMLSLSIACTSSKGDSASEDGDDTTDDTTDTSDTDDTDVTPPPSYFEPSFLGFAIEAPYSNNEISTITYGGSTLGGTFIVLLTDIENLTTTYYDPTYSCWLTFEFDNSLVADATSTAVTANGSFVDDGGWLAWTIDSAAYMGKNGACDNVDPLGQWGATIASLEAGTYGFGFGTLTPDLEDSLSENVDDWANEGKYYYAGYVGTDVIDGNYKYYDVNRGLAWDITGGELTTNDDGTIANAQVDFTGAVFMTDNAYYSASPWFGWGFN